MNIAQFASSCLGTCLKKILIYFSQQASAFPTLLEIREQVWLECRQKQTPCTIFSLPCDSSGENCSSCLMEWVSSQAEKNRKKLLKLPSVVKKVSLCTKHIFKDSFMLISDKNVPVEVKEPPADNTGSHKLWLSSNSQTLIPTYTSCSLTLISWKSHYLQGELCICQLGKWLLKLIAIAVVLVWNGHFKHSFLFFWVGFFWGGAGGRGKFLLLFVHFIVVDIKELNSMNISASCWHLDGQTLEINWPRQNRWEWLLESVLWVWAITLITERGFSLPFSSCLLFKFSLLHHFLSWHIGGNQIPSWGPSPCPLNTSESKLVRVGSTLIKLSWWQIDVSLEELKPPPPSPKSSFQFRELPLIATKDIINIWFFQKVIAQSLEVFFKNVGQLQNVQKCDFTECS